MNRDFLKNVLDYAIQFMILIVLAMMFFLLFSLQSCSSYPVLPQGDYGTEPIEDYVAVGFLPEHPDDEKPVTVRVGELRYASYVFDSYYALIDVTNARGDRIENLLEERSMLLATAELSQKTGKINTLLGVGSGILGGVLATSVFVAVLSL